MFPDKSILGVILRSLVERTGLDYELIVSPEPSYGLVVSGEGQDLEFDGMVGMVQRGVRTWKRII